MNGDIENKLKLSQECKRFFYYDKLLMKNDKILKNNYLWKNFIERFILKDGQKDIDNLSIEDNFFDKEWAYMSSVNKSFEHLNKDQILNKIKNILQNYNKDKQIIFAKNIKVVISTNKFNITINYRKEILKYEMNIPEERIKCLKKLANNDLIAIMIMRYACLHSNGQQWSHNKAFYKYFLDNYDCKLEGFASPLNSRLMLLEGFFCSLFPEVDKPFGSLCQFTEAYYENTTVLANPPFISYIIEDAVNHAIKNLNDAKKYNYKVRFIFTFPIFESKSYFSTLNNSEYLVKKFFLPAFQHSYENLSGIKKKFNLDTHFYILSYGYEDNYENIYEEVYEICK